MAKYYAFLGPELFCKTNSLSSAINIAKDESHVYRHVDGIPNPWWVHPMKNGKIDKDTIIKGLDHRKRNGYKLKKDGSYERRKNSN